MSLMTFIFYLLIGIGGVMGVIAVRMFTKRTKKRMEKLVSSDMNIQKENLRKMIYSPITKWEVFTTIFVFASGMLAFIYSLITSKPLLSVLGFIMWSSSSITVYQLAKSKIESKPVKINKPLSIYSSFWIPVGVAALTYGALVYLGIL